MTKRERKYHYTDHKFKKAFRLFSKTNYENLLFYGYAGSWVGLNDNGNVEIRALTINEITELLEKQNNGESIPPEIKIITHSI